MRRYHYFPLSGPLLAAALCLALAVHICQVRPQADRSYGRYTVQQILDRSEPICRLLAPQASDLHLTADPILVGEVRPYWDVECADPSSKDLTYLSWDASTGQLCLASRVSHTSQGTGKPFNSREAVEATWQWLRSLGIAEQASHWRIVGSPRYRSHTWTVIWSAADRRALMQVHALTHELVTACCSPLSTSSSVEPTHEP